MAVVAVLFRRKIHPAFRDLREQNAVLSTKTQENISGARVVKAFAQEEYEKKSFRKENQEQLRLALRTTFIWSDYVPVLDFLGNLCTPLLLGVGGVMVVNGVMSLGELITFTGYIWMITGPMRSLGNLMNMFTNAHTSAEQLFYYKDLGASIKDKPQTRFPEEFRGHVVFDHVDFSYGDQMVLKDICLDVPAGSTVAVILRVSTSSTRFIRSVDNTTPPSVATQPPHSPVPAPRGVTAMLRSLQ